ncbi:MAG: DUF3604 domain-containing protein [bacterium]
MAHIAKIRLGAILLLLSVFIALGLTPRGRAPRVRVLLSPEITTSGIPGTYRVSFVIDEDSLSAGGGFKVRFVKGFTKPQTSNPYYAGYVTAQASNPGAVLAITQIVEDDSAIAWPVDRNAWVLTAIVGRQALVRGDTVHITYGANPEQGVMPGLVSAFTDTVRVACDFHGRGNYEEIGPAPVLTILPGPPRWLAAYLPSRVPTDEPANLKLACLDAQGNLAVTFSGEVKISCTDPRAEVPSLVTFNPEDRGHKIVAMRFRSPGIHEIYLQALGLPWPEMASNPVEVAAEKPQYLLYWGDLHSHSSFSFDGYGKEPFAAARDAAGLDFYALTEHGSYGAKANSGLTTAEWEHVKREVVRYHQPGQFVTIPAVEFSAAPPSGHHNIYFNAQDAIVPQLPLLREENYMQTQRVWAEKAHLLPAGVDMLTIPHHTGIVWGPAPGGGILHAGVSFGPGFSNEHLRPLIELYSQHGLSEAYAPDHPLSYKSLHPGAQRDLLNGPHYAQDAWALGEHLGVIASSDDHTSRPGRDNVGVAAVYATALTREAIFDALKNRRTYATTGRRLLLHFDVNGNLMGSRFTIQSQQYPKLSVRVTGTHDLDFVEILRWEEKSGLYQNGHPAFTSLLKAHADGRYFIGQFVDSSYSASSLYYVRVKQMRSGAGGQEAWAWSSPVWVRQQGDDGGTLPRRFELSPGYPNPFRSVTALRYFLPRPARLKAVLYNTLAQQVETLLESAQTEGWHHINVSGRHLSPGIYFVRMEAGGRIATQKIVVMK